MVVFFTYLHHRRTENDDLNIQRCAVLPLSHSAGLISWVPQCDTLHDLIRDYRESRKIILNVEQKLMQQMAPEQMYDSLSLMQKLEVSERVTIFFAVLSLISLCWIC